MATTQLTELSLEPSIAKERELEGDNWLYWAAEQYEVRENRTQHSKEVEPKGNPILLTWSSAEMCHTLVEETISEAEGRAVKEQNKRTMLCSNIVARLITRAVATSDRKHKAKIGWCRTLVRLAATKAVARSEAKAARLAKSKYKKCEVLVIQAMNLAVTRSQSKDLGRPTKKRKCETRDTENVLEIELSCKRRRKMECAKKPGVAENGMELSVERTTWREISVNNESSGDSNFDQLKVKTPNSRKFPKKSSYGVKIYRGKSKTSRRKETAAQKNLITQYFGPANPRPGFNQNEFNLKQNNLEGGKMAVGGDYSGGGGGGSQLWAGKGVGEDTSSISDFQIQLKHSSTETDGRLDHQDSLAVVVSCFTDEDH